MAVNSVTPAQQDAIAGLYAAFWNRAPDTTGFGFWVNKLATGAATLDEIATEFRNAPEGVAEYPTWSTNVELVTEVYANVFGRAPDAEGLAFWTAKLTSGQVTFPELVVDMVEAAETNGSNDGLLFTNKVIVGVYVATVAQTDNGYVCDNAFSQVTYEASSVATAEAWVDANNTGATYTLTTNIDTINVTGQKVDTVVGLTQGTNQTYNTGDTVNGNNKTNVSLVANGNAGTDLSPIVDLNNIASVNVNLTADSSINATEFTNVAQVALTSGVAGAELTVEAAQLATTYAINVARAETLTIGSYAAATGTADTVALSVAGAGLKATAGNRAAFDVAGGNAVEAVTLSTTGTNYVDLAAGTGAKSITVTGSGTNDLTVTSAATTFALNASATTGANRFDLGTLANSTTTVTGGTGADTLALNLNKGLTYNPTVSAVENLEANFSITGATYNASKTTGLDSVAITATATGGTAKFSNLNASVDAVAIGTKNAIDAGVVTVGYASKSVSDVVVNVGATSTTSNPAVVIDGLTVTGNTGALTINSVGDAANSITASIDATAVLNADNATSLTIKAVDQALVISNTNGGPDAVVSALGANTLTIDSTLKAVTVNDAAVGAFDNTILVDGSLATYNVTSGAGAAIVGDLILDAGTGENTDLTANITSGAKSVLVGTITVAGQEDDTTLDYTLNVNGGAGAVEIGATTLLGASKTSAATPVTYTATINGGAGAVTLGDTAAESADDGSLNATVTIAGGAGLVSTGAYSFTSATKALNADVEITSGAGGVNTGALTFDGGAGVAAAATVTATTAVDGDITTGDITLGADKTGSTLGVVLAAVAGSITVDAIDVVGATGLGTVTLALEAAANESVTITSLVESGAGASQKIGSITTAGAGDITVGGSTFVNSNTTTVDGTLQTGSLNVNLAASTGNLSVFLGDASSDDANTVVTGSGNDEIVGGSGIDNITANTGADYIVTNGGVDTMVQGISDSVARSASSFAAATVAAGDTMTFGSGVDVISGFTAGTGGDVLNVLAAGLPTTLIGETVANLTATQEVFFASGSYNASTGLFTIAANGIGADTMIVQADQAVAASDALTTNASIVVLVGVDSDALVAANFI